MSKLTPGWQKASVLESVFDQLSDALVLYDPEFRITGVNRAAEKLFGLSSEEMLGKHCQDIFKCSVCEPGCGVLVGLNQAPAAPNCTVRLNTDNGLERLVVMRTNQMFDDSGILTGVVATIKDITEAAAPQKREVISESGPMREVLNFVRRVAASEATTILLEGENGTGKDLVAKTLHYQSLRQAEPFISINCAAIPETLLESELFGYEKGAFTDARAQKRGIFELADKGTLFLDEIGEIPLMLQAKLLRVLEDQTFRRLGGLKDIKLDLRVVAATNKNLREAVKEGAFRQDLYFRLNVIRRHRTAYAVLYRALQPQVQAQHRRCHRRGSQAAAVPRLARQRSRATQCHRTRHDPRGFGADYSPEPANCDLAAGSWRTDRHPG
jgi:PAS domain S-box-containing protein